MSKLQIEGWTVIGESVGSVGTCLAIPELKLCFDMGITPRTADMTKYGTVLISHGHCDHIGGLHFHARLRLCKKLPKPTYILPSECIADFNEMYRSVQNLDGDMNTSLDYVIVPANEHLNYELKKSYRLSCFTMTHVIPAYGYVISMIKNKLKPAYLKCTGQELKSLRAEGKVITEEHRQPEIAFTGDTTIEGILRQPDMLRSKILIAECTFLDDDVSPTQAKEYGHIHIQDIVEHETEFLNQALILTHFSARYTREQIIEKVALAGFSETFRVRIRLLLPM